LNILDNFNLSYKIPRDTLFSWYKIPGKDNVRLLKYLKQKFNIEWIKTGNIEKSMTAGL